EALYVHIKRLWGMLTPGAIPEAPDKQLLKEFYQRFSSAEEVKSVAHNSQGVKLINKAQVQTLCNAQAGKRKIVKELPPGGKQNPDERPGDISFNYKDWD
ncbi:hypothetical protein O181_119111, partial [Austropuccinia psidii MF-1]|nr:hypothetical protein [Austropuccinia psidii MF-1]